MISTHPVTGTSSAHTVTVVVTTSPTSSRGRVTSCESSNALTICTGLDIVAETGCCEERDENKEESSKGKGLHVCGLLEDVRGCCSTELILTCGAECYLVVTRISGELEGIGLIWCPERSENVVGRYRQPCLAFPQPYGANAKF